MKRLLIFALLVLCLLSNCSVVNEFQNDNLPADWTIFRGSPSLCGNSECDVPDNPRLLWSRTTQTRTVASPIVYDGVVYTLDRKGKLRSYSENGDSSLVYDFKTSVEASFMVHDSILYVGRIDGFVNALSVKKKRIVWKYETLGQISGSPNLIMVNGKPHLLVGSYDSNMYVFDAVNGTKKHQHETGYYINGTAAVWRKYMVYGGCDTWLRIVDTTTGITTDSLQLDTYLPASPAILEDVAYEADYNGNIYEIKLENGRFVHHRKLVDNENGNKNDNGNEDDNSGLVSMPTATYEAVIALTGERYVSCFERSSGKLRWKKMLRGITGECSPVVCNDKVIVCTKDGHISLFDLQDGTELWHYEAGEQIIASPAVVPGRFYILTSRGTLLCFS